MILTANTGAAILNKNDSSHRQPKFKADIMLAVEIIGGRYSGIEN